MAGQEFENKTTGKRRNCK